MSEKTKKKKKRTIQNWKTMKKGGYFSPHKALYQEESADATW